MESLSEGMQRLSIMIMPFLVAVIFHEVAHGWAALRWGDPTARDEGRLTFNPTPHIDVMGTLALPMIMFFTGSSFLFGWARPVPINPTRFTKYRPGLFWVSIAGPAMNFAIGLASAFACAAVIRYVPRDFYLFEPLLGMTKVSVGLNFSLGVFNLLPLPPLDGSKIIESFLPYNAMRAYESVAQYSFWIMLALIFTGALSILGGPIEFLTNTSLYLAIRLLGVPVNFS